MNNERQYLSPMQGAFIPLALCAGLHVLAWPALGLANPHVLAWQTAGHAQANTAVPSATSELKSVEIVSVDVSGDDGDVPVLRVRLLNRSAETIVAVHFDIRGPDPNTQVGFATRATRDSEPGAALMGPNGKCSVEIPAGNVKPDESLVLDAALFASGIGDGTRDALDSLREMVAGGASREP